MSETNSVLGKDLVGLEPLTKEQILYIYVQAKSQLGYASFGLTAFKIFNLDIASALDTVKIDGEKLPQGLMVSLGFQIAW